MSSIIVVDDEPAVQSYVKDLFRRDGHEVLTAVDAEELFALLRQGLPDVILLDIGIPGETGLSLLKRLPKSPDKRVPVIIFSGQLTQELEMEAYEAGAVEVIHKGGNLKEIRQKINKIIGSEGDVFKKVSEGKSEDVILVVDDEASINDLICEIFNSKGFKTIQAFCGEDAIEMVKEHRPKMILLDVMMPGMSGIETLKCIREIDPDVGVVMATGLEDEKLAQESADLGSYAYVVKPFNLKYLEMVVLTRLVMAS